MKKISLENILETLDQNLKEKNWSGFESLINSIPAEQRGITSIKKRRASYNLKKGNVQNALKLFLEILNEEKDYAGNYVNLLKISVRHNIVNKEIYEIAKKAYALFPENKDICVYVGKFSILAENNIDAYNVLNRALKHYPNNLDILNDLGFVKSQLSLGDLGKSELERALDIARLEGNKIKEASILSNLCRVYFNRDENENFIRALDESKKSKRTTLNQDMYLIEFYERLSMLEEMKEVIAESRKSYGDTFVLNLFEAIYNKRIKNYKRQEEILMRLKLPEGISKSISGRYYAELANVYEHRAEYDLAYNMYRKANEIQLKIVGGKENNDKVKESRYEELKRWSEIIPFLRSEHRSLKVDEPQPVFFVGFPRSGTTLIDQILSSHSKCEVIEEKPIVAKVIEKLTSWHGEYPSKKILELKENERNELRELYFQELEMHKLKEKKEVDINKFPLDIISLPLIWILFPRAKIITAIRHPMGCCLSGFKQQFSYNRSMAHFLSMDDIVIFYSKVMANYVAFVNQIDKNIHQIRYEDLVSDFKKNIDSLLKFLNLDWEDSIENFYKTALNKKMIKTPSYTQVTQPIYQSSAYKWRDFENELRQYQPALQQFIDKFGY